jgi:hypothetical protein
MATTVNTLETNTEVFKGDRVVADGVERSLGDVTTDVSLSGDLTPAMTGPSTPSGSASSSSNDSTGPAWEAFDDIDGGASRWITSSGHTTGWLQYTFNTGTIVNYITLISSDTTARCPTAWTIRGSTDNFATVDDILDTQTSITDWVLGVVKTFDFVNTTAYTSYRINITANNGDASYVSIGAMELKNNTVKYSADFNTPLASIPTSVYRLDHDNLTIDGTPTATTATILDSRTGLIASGDTVLLDGVGVVCNPVVETEVSVDSTNSLTVGTATAIATYKLDDAFTGGTDTTVDLSGNYNGTATGVTSASATINGRVTDVGVFNGSTSFVDIPVSSFSPTVNTVSLWVKGTNTSIVGLFSARAGDNRVNMIIALSAASAGDITIDSGNGSSFVRLISVAGTYNDNLWHHIVCSVNTATTAYMLYIDNVLKANSTNAGIGATTIDKISLGKNYSTQFLTGSIDQVRIFNRALTGTEVTALYNETAAGYQYDLTYPTQTAPTRIALSGNDIVPTVASDTFDGTDTFTRTYNTVTKTARDVEYGFVADEEVEIVQFNLNQNMEP